MCSTPPRREDVGRAAPEVIGAQGVDVDVRDAHLAEG